MFATARSATCKTSTRFMPRVYHKSASPLRTAHLPNEAAKAHEKFFIFFLFIRCSPRIQDGPGGVYKSGCPSGPAQFQSQCSSFNRCRRISFRIPDLLSPEKQRGFDSAV